MIQTKPRITTKHKNLDMTYYNPHCRWECCRRSRRAATSAVISARKVGVLFWQICINFVHIFLELYKLSNNQGNNRIPFIMMKASDSKPVKYALGAIGVGVLVYGLYKLYKHLKATEQAKSGINSSFECNQLDQSQVDGSFISQSNEHHPYDILIEDSFKDHLGNASISNLNYLKDISYRIILSLMKGNSYQGIVNLSFLLEGLPEDEQNLKINFSGSGIKYLMINGHCLEAKEIVYKQHHIFVPRELLKEKAKNSIEVIFENFYSFLNEGLSTYFMVDEHQKYSLRQQVIYSVNGYLDVEKFIPCFNCLNECKVQIEVIHSDTFEVFSNTAKSLQRLCSVAEYQKYPFLFDLTSSSLNKSFKLNQSTLSNYSGIENSLTMSYSSVNYYNRKKANSHFYKEKLPCIHHMFIFSSSVIELQPTSINNPLDSELLLRYFCKHTESHRLVKNVNKIHNYILDVFRRLNSENIKGYINKIDILIIADRDVEGYFAPGVIILCQDTLKENNISIRCFYLIVRALMGLLQLEKGSKVITLKEILTLNESVFLKFEEFRNYLFIKNKKFQKIRWLINSQGEFVEHYEGYFLRYFSKELRFTIADDVVNKISFELNNLMLSFKPEVPELFWENFLANNNFLSPLIIEPLIKLGLRQIGLPNNLRLLEQMKSSFSNSKYFLSFYTNEEISDNLPKFIEVEAYGLEQRLTQIKVKQKFKDYITERYEMYLPIRSNVTEAETMYLEFKQFNECKNFHHVSVLKSQIKRITFFGKNFISPERVPLNCSTMGWKMLRMLKLYPSNEDLYQLIRVFEGLP